MISDDKSHFIRFARPTTCILQLIENIHWTSNNVTALKCVYCVQSVIVDRFKMSSDIGDDSSLDQIFSEVGEFGLFQIATYLLISIPCILTSGFDINYIVTTQTLHYRWVPFSNVLDIDWNLNFEIKNIESKRFKNLVNYLVLEYFLKKMQSARMWRRCK